MPDFLFVDSQEETESTLDWDESEDYTHTFPPEPSFRADIEEKVDLLLEMEEKVISPLVELEQEVHQTEIDSALLVEKELDEIDTMIEEIDIYDEADIQKESNSLEESNVIEDEYDLNYMEELEKIITSESSTDLNQYTDDSKEEIAETVHNDLLADREDIDFSFLEKDVEAVSNQEVEDKQLLETRHEIILEVLDELEDVTDAEDAEENTEIILVEELVSPQVNEVSQKIINNTFQQLQLMKKLMDPKEYENIVSRCLKADMPLHEYYLIASLLIEHYIQQNEKTKLQSFFPLLKDKFKQESILLAQIIFMEKHYKL